jgi:hypothetical protein
MRDKQGSNSRAAAPAVGSASSPRFLAQDRSDLKPQIQIRRIGRSGFPKTGVGWRVPTENRQFAVTRTAGLPALLPNLLI